MAASTGGVPGSTRLRSAAPLLIAGGLLALALFWLLEQSRLPPRPAPDAGPSVAFARAPVEPLSAPRDDAAGAPEDELPTVFAEKPTSQAQGPSAPAAKREPVEALPPSPRGGSVTGIVVDSRGEPVVGARVLASIDAGCRPLDALGASGAHVRSASTGENGGFALGGLPAGPLRVAVRAPGFGALEIEDLRLLAGQVLDLGLVGLERGVVVRGRVRSDRSGFDFAHVLAFDDRLLGPWRELGIAMARPLAVTNASGQFYANTLPPGRWRLVITAEGHVPAYVEGFTSARQGESASLDVTLVAATPMAVRVPPGGRGERVAAWTLEGPLRPQECEPGIAPYGLSAYREVPAPEAIVVLPGIEEDALVELRLLAAWEDPLERDAFTLVHAVRNTGAIADLRRLPGGEVRVEVRRAVAATAVEAFEVRLEGALHATWRSPPPETWSEGRVRLRDVRPRGEPRVSPRSGEVLDAGPFSLVVEAPGYEPARVDGLTIAPGQVLDLAKLYLTPLPTLHVRVVDDRDGAPLSGGELLLHAPEGPVFGRTRSRARSGRDGLARLTSLTAGTGSLLVTRRGFTPQRQSAPSPFGSEQHPVEVRMRPAGALAVQTLALDGSPAAAQVVRLRQGAELDPYQLSPDEPEVDALVDGQGRVLLQDLEPGAHSIAVVPLARILAPWIPRPWVRAAVPADDTAKLVQHCEALLPLELTVLSGGKPLAHALVRIAAGKEPFRDPYADGRRLRAHHGARTGEDGRCRFEGLAPGGYTLRIEGEAGFHRRELELSSRQTSQRFDVLDTFVSGSLVLPDGQGELMGQSVQLVAYRGSWRRIGAPPLGSTLEELDPEEVELGETAAVDFAFRGMPAGVELELRGLALGEDGRWLLAQRALAAFAPGAAYADTDLRLEPAGALELLLDQSKRVPEGLAVLGYNLDEPWGRGRFARRLAEGSLHVPALPTGRWRVCLARVDARGTILELGSWKPLKLPADAPMLVRLVWR